MATVTPMTTARGLAVTGGQHDGGEHRLVGQLGEEHDAEGDEKCL
jgi:hypothetical protein